MYIVYETKNLITNSTYIGVHKCINYNIFDGYLGSGYALKLAVKKYGRNAFKRKTLCVCSDAKYAYLIENKLVDSFYVENNKTYNLAIGGCGTKHSKQSTGEKISKACKGRKPWNKGIPRTKEERQKISKARRGKSPLSQKVFDSRIQDIKLADKKYGWKSTLARKWGISPQCACFFIASHKLDVSMKVN